MNKTEISIPCSGYTITANWYDNDGSRRILLVFVGLYSNKANNAELVIAIAAETKMSALVVDLSGQGESPFKLDDICPAQHVLESIAVFDWLRHTYPDSEICIMGTSYGGFMAAWLTRYRNFEKLLLRTPAIYKPGDFYTHHEFIHDEQALQKYRSADRQVARHPLFLQESVFSGPAILMIHGEDEDIPPQTSEAYRQTFSAKVYTAEGFKHAMRDSSNPQDQLAAYQKTIVDYLKSVE